MGRALKEVSIDELRNKILSCEENKKKILSRINDLKEKVLARDISYSEYEELLEQKLQGKTFQEWLDFYQDYIKNCQELISKKNNQKIVKKVLAYSSIIFIIASLFTLFFYLSPVLVGFLVKAPVQEFTQQINLNFNQSQDYELQLEHQGILESLKISGDILNQGQVKVYLDDLLILDSNKIKQKAKLTGLAVEGEATSNPSQEASPSPEYTSASETSTSQEQTSQETPTQQEAPSIPSQEAPPSENPEEIPEEQPPVETPPQEPEENITPTENITPPEEPQENITLPENITEENITQPPENVTPPTPPEENITQPPENITHIEFVDICEETCKNLNLNQTSYKLRIEITNSELNLREIKYEIATEAAIENITIPENVTPVLIKNIPDISIQKNKQASIDLSDYFQYADKFSILQAENILTTVQKNNLKIMPEKDFTGERESEITAINSFGEIKSNSFKIIVSEFPEEIANITQVNFTETTFQYKAVIGKPVKWIKNISLEKPGAVTVELPKQAENITVKKITQETPTQSEAPSSPSQEAPPSETTKENITETPIQEQGNITQEQNITETPEENIILEPANSLITGQVISSSPNFLQKLFSRLTGRAITTEETQEKIEVKIEDNASQYIIEYETPAPQSYEEETAKGKRIIISAPAELNYTDILAFTELPEESQEEKIKLYWLKEEKVNITNENNETIEEIQETREQVEITKYDLNNNSLIDYIEWIVPHLSNQTYELIIEITGAEHLDENRTFISDIYQEVRALDDIWSEEIPANDYVRVTFQKNLTSENDITIYLRIISGNPKIQVYEFNKTELIAEFTSLIDNEYNKVFLTNLTESQDTFDLRILGGSIQLDYIVDPITNQIDYFIGGNGTTTGTGTISTSTGALTAKWNLPSSLSNLTFIKQYTTSKVITTAPINVSFYCNKSIVGSGDSVTISAINVYDCGTSATCATLDATICGGSVSFNCDSATILFYSYTCTPSAIRTLDTNDYLGVRFQPTESKTNASIWFNSSTYPSGINITEQDVDTTPPQVTNLSSPANNTYFSSASNIVFNCSMIDTGEGLKNSTLYGNWSGGWHANETRVVNGINVLNSTNFTKTIPNGDAKYIWNCKVCDKAATTNCAFNDTNYTFTIDTTKPNIAIVYPSNNSNFTTKSIEVNYTRSDIALQSCWYTNNSINPVNYTLTGCANITGVQWLEGLNNITIYTNDSAGNQNYSKITFNVDTIPPYFTGIITNNISVNDSQTWKIQYNATDETGFSNFSVNWTTNFTISALNGATSKANLTNSSIVYYGLYMINITINDTSNNNASIVLNVTVNATPPYFIDSTPQNQTLSYLTALNYDINASDESGIQFVNFSVNDTSNFTINSSGFLKNKTALGVNIYWLNITINDTLNNTNSTTIFVNITKATPTLTNYINSQTDNISIVYPDIVNASAYSNETTTVKIYVNSTKSPTRTDVTANNGVNLTLGADNYTFIFNVTGNQNYSDIATNIMGINVTINITSNITLHINGTRENFTTANSSTTLNIWLNATNITGEGNVSIIVNGTLYNNGTSPQANLTNLSIGLYNITAYSAQTQNYTSANETWWVNITVIPPLIALDLIYPTSENVTSGLNVTQNQFFNVTVNVSCSQADCGDINISLDPVMKKTYYPNTTNSLAWTGGHILTPVTLGKFRDNAYTSLERNQTSVDDANYVWAGTHGTLDNSCQGRIQTADCSVLTEVQCPSYYDANEYACRTPEPDVCIQGDICWMFPGHEIQFKIAEERTMISNISIRVVSFGDYYNDGVLRRLAVYNWTSSSYVEYDTETCFSGGPPANYECNLTALITDPLNFINSTGYLDVILYDSSEAPPQTVRNYYAEAKINYTKGLISTVEGTTPFYTNVSNPNTTSLNNGQSAIVVFWVNATGFAEGTYEFFAYANQTENLSISNITSKWNVTILPVAANTPPQITYIQNSTLTGAIVVPTIASYTPIKFNLTVYDEDGTSNINTASVKANFTANITGEALRENSSCSEIAGETTDNSLNFSCTIDMWYWDANTTWNITVYAEDDEAASAQNTTATFDYSSVAGFIISPDMITFPTLTPGDINKSSLYNTTLNNTGNIIIIPNNISVNATNLRGISDITQFLNAGNFTASWNKTTTGKVGPCDNSTTGTATRLVSNVSTGIAGANLTRGNVTIGDGRAQEVLYYCIPKIPQISSQIYATNESGAWTIKIALVLVFTPRFKRKKKKLARDDNLVKALNLISKEQIEEYSKEKEELISILIKEIKKKLRINNKQVSELVEARKEFNIPVTIFIKEVGILETLVRYMKENLSMNYHEIALLLNRNERTIWTAYNQAVNKQKKSIKPEETQIFLPISIFEDRKLTILESTIIYLKEQKLRFSEIAKLLDRDQRNIYTIYSRAVRKIKRKV